MENIAITIFAYLFGFIVVIYASCVTALLHYNKSKKPRPISAIRTHLECYYKLICIKDRVGIKRHGFVAGIVGDDIIIGFHDNIAPIKDIEASVELYKEYYKSYCLINKDVLHEAYNNNSKNRVLNVDVNWCFRNLSK